MYRPRARGERLEQAVTNPGMLDDETAALVSIARALAPSIHQSEHSRAQARAAMLREFERAQNPRRAGRARPDTADVHHDMVVESGGRQVRLVSLEPIGDEQAREIAALAAEAIAMETSQVQRRQP